MLGKQQTSSPHRRFHALKTHMLAIDQGTTGSTVLLFDRQGRVAGKGYREITQHYPQPGWVEHDAEEIWARTLEALADCLTFAPR